MTSEKIAWVTGATSGVGRHLTGCLLQRGWQVLATGRDESLLHQVAEQDRWPKDKIFLLRQDVRSSDDWETVCNHLLKRWGQFDLLLNIAAYLNPGYPSAVSDGDIDTHFDTNVKGLIKGCRTASRVMVEKGQGHIVNIASMAALATSAGLSLYSASKFAVRSYTLGLAMELRDKGVSVTVMCPDAIDTPMLEKQEQCEEGAMTFSGVTLTLADIEHSLFDTVLTKKPLEVCLPASRGWQAKLGNLFPPLMLKLASRMNAKGLKRQQQAAEQRNL